MLKLSSTIIPPLSNKNITFKLFHNNVNIKLIDKGVRTTMKQRNYSLLRGDKEQEELSRQEKAESIRKRVSVLNSSSSSGRNNEDNSDGGGKLKEKKKDASLQYANKSFTEILANILRGSIRFFAQNYYLGFGLILTLAIVYTLDVFNLRSESMLSERAKLEELIIMEVADSEAGVRLLRIQSRTPFQRPTTIQQHSPPYYYHQHQHNNNSGAQLLPNIYPPPPVYINQPPPPPPHRQSRYDESVLFNPNRTISERDVPSDEHLDRTAHRLHQDLYHHYQQCHHNQVPYHHGGLPNNDNHFPFPQHQTVPLHPIPSSYQFLPFPQQQRNQPKLLNPDGKQKTSKDKKKRREKLLLDPFYPIHGDIVQTEELKKDQRKKQKLLFKRFDSKENSVTTDNISIQLLKSNFPQQREKQILPTYVEDESSSTTTEESSISIVVETNDKGVQINQPQPTTIIQSTIPKKEAPPPPSKKECKDHLFDAFRHSGHLHSRIIDLETYFQILEKQEREGNDNSLLDIAVLNNTNFFPDKPLQTNDQIPIVQTDMQIHNVSCIPLFSSNSTTTTATTGSSKVQKNAPTAATTKSSNNVEIVYELEDYMSKELTNSLRKSVTISDKTTVLTYSNSKIQPVQHSVAHMPIYTDIDEQIYPVHQDAIEALPTIVRIEETTPPLRQPISAAAATNPSFHKTDRTVLDNNNQIGEKLEVKSVVKKEEFIKINTPKQKEQTTETASTIENFNEDEPKPPPFEERVIFLEEVKPAAATIIENIIHQPKLPVVYVPPKYLDKIIYVDDLRKKESPKKQEPTIVVDYTPVEMPYYEERVIYIGQQDPKESPLETQMITTDDDDNISVTTIGSQETYQDYLQRIGIDVDSMPYSSEAIRRKLEMQMAISARNSLNFSRGSLLFPSDFEDPNLMLSTLATTLRDTLTATTTTEKNSAVASHMPTIHSTTENDIADDQRPPPGGVPPPSQTDTIENALRNILKNSKIKSKLDKLKEANIDTSILNKKYIQISEIEEFKKLSNLVETEYMKNADYLIAQTEQLKKETKEAIEKIDTQLVVGSRNRERFNETIDTIYHQRR